MHPSLAVGGMDEASPGNGKTASERRGRRCNVSVPDFVGTASGVLKLAIVPIHQQTFTGTTRHPQPVQTRRHLVQPSHAA